MNPQIEICDYPPHPSSNHPQDQINQLIHQVEFPDYFPSHSCLNKSDVLPVVPIRLSIPIFENIDTPADHICLNQSDQLIVTHNDYEISPLVELIDTEAHPLFMNKNDQLLDHQSEDVDCLIFVQFPHPIDPSPIHPQVEHPDRSQSHIQIFLISKFSF